MRQLVLLVLALPLLVVPGRTTLAAWDDPSTADAPGLTAITLTAPTVTCQQVDVLNGLGVRLLTKAVLTWTASTTPTTLTYDASILTPSVGLTVGTSGLTRTTEVLPSLLGGLLGSDITVRVTGTLPGTNFVVTTDRVLHSSVLGISVTC